MSSLVLNYKTMSGCGATMDCFLHIRPKFQWVFYVVGVAVHLTSQS